MANNSNDFSHYRLKLFSFFYFLLHFRSESPSQAILFLIEWILVTLQTFQRTNGVRSSYHMTCAMWMQSMSHRRLCTFIHLLTEWLKANKIIDSLHIAYNKSEGCKEKYNPAKLKDILPDGHTMAGKQTFTWLSRFRKILCSMSKVHHMFFLQRMVVRRNAYTVTYYKNRKKPVLPKAGKGTRVLLVFP